jgi:hypothetical protein
VVKTRRTPLIHVRRKTTYTEGGSVHVVEQDSQHQSIQTSTSSSSKKIIDLSKKSLPSFKPGKNLWKNVPTAIRYAKSPTAHYTGLHKGKSDPEVDLRLAEMCEKAFVTGELECKAYTLEEIGNYVGISRERIRQIQDEALNNLRGHIKQSFGWEMDLRDLIKSNRDTIYDGI